MMLKTVRLSTYACLLMVAAASCGEKSPQGFEASFRGESQEPAKKNSKKKATPPESTTTSQPAKVELTRAGAKVALDEFLLGKREGNLGAIDNLFNEKSILDRFKTLLKFHTKLTPARRAKLEGSGVTIPPTAHEFLVSYVFRFFVPGPILSHVVDQMITPNFLILKLSFEQNQIGFRTGARYSSHSIESQYVDRPYIVIPKIKLVHSLHQFINRLHANWPEEASSLAITEGDLSAYLEVLFPGEKIQNLVETQNVVINQVEEQEAEPVQKMEEMARKMERNIYEFPEEIKMMEKIEFRFLPEAKIR